MRRSLKFSFMVFMVIASFSVKASFEEEVAQFDFSYIRDFNSKVALGEIESYMQLFYNTFCKNYSRVFCDKVNNQFSPVEKKLLEEIERMELERYRVQQDKIKAEIESIKNLTKQDWNPTTKEKVLFGGTAVVAFLSLASLAYYFGNG